MNEKKRGPRFVPIRLVVGTILSGLLAFASNAEEFHLSVSQEFTDQLDLSAIRLIAVQEDGRVKTFDSLAREKLKFVNSKATRKTEPVVFYLDMMIAFEQYRGANLIFVKKPSVRRDVIQGIREQVPSGSRRGLISNSELARFEETGLISLDFTDHPTVQAVLADLQRDLMRTNKEIGKIFRARSIADHRTLHGMFAVIPSPGETDVAPWYPLAQLFSSAAPRDEAHSGMVPTPTIPGLDESTRTALLSSWYALEKAWKSEDAPEANRSFASLAETLAKVDPNLYPSSTRLSLEHFYYKTYKMTWVWLFYFFALPILLMAVVYGFGWARILGVGLFGLGFVAHTTSIGIRWYLAGRIPNANMFEAVMASAWFGCVVAIVLEITLRKKPVRNMAALCASTYAMLAMMIGYFYPILLNSDITTVMPVLDRTIWLYIHTNIVIASYALIFFGSVTAVVYLLGRLMSRFVAKEKRSDWTGRKGGLPKSLDGATMIFLQMAFIALWVGTALGAIWADVSWGRPWGWDPKEVFALNTWIILLILVHVRMRVQEKALWTAAIAVVACAVMLFNWIAVNFVVVGLHSYA